MLKTKFVSLFLCSVFLSSCEQAPLNSEKIREKNGHIYLWKSSEGYMHDPKCPGCKHE